MDRSAGSGPSLYDGNSGDDSGKENLEECAGKHSSQNSNDELSFERMNRYGRPKMQLATLFTWRKRQVM